MSTAWYGALGYLNPQQQGFFLHNCSFWYAPSKMGGLYERHLYQVLNHEEFPAICRSFGVEYSSLQLWLLRHSCFSFKSTVNLKCNLPGYLLLDWVHQRHEDLQISDSHIHTNLHQYRRFRGDSLSMITWLRLQEKYHEEKSLTAYDKL